MEALPAVDLLDVQHVQIVHHGQVHRGADGGRQVDQDRARGRAERSRERDVAAELEHGDAELVAVFGPRQHAEVHQLLGKPVDGRLGDSGSLREIGQPQGQMSVLEGPEQRVRLAEHRVQRGIDG
ncbi:hypothetical protein JCM18899A_42560 [Nocardioides sp. AN3]